MKYEYYVVDENDLTIKKALLDLESSEFFFTFESTDGIQYKDPIACSRCKMIKYYNELTNDEHLRTGKSYKEDNIFGSEDSAKKRLKEVIKEKADDIQNKINKLTRERESLINKLFNV